MSPMKQYKPREYQSDAVAKVFAAIERGVTRLLYVLATAMGKTVIMGAIIDDLLMDEKKVLVLAHREELIMSAYRTIKGYCKLTDYQIGAEMADEWKAPRSCSVMVASVPTLQGNRLLRVHQFFQPDVIIVDEAHRAVGDSYVNIYREMGVFDGRCVLIGCTATDFRSDGQQLWIKDHDGTVAEIKVKKIVEETDERTGKIVHKTVTEMRAPEGEECLFQEVVCRYDTWYGINNGYLTDLLRAKVHTGVDISKVPKTKGGEYQEKALGLKIQDDHERTLAIIKGWEMAEKEHRGRIFRCKDQPTICFCATVEHADNAAAMWSDLGYTARAINGMTDGNERKRAFEDFQRGDLQVLCNYGVYLEGTDLPNVGAVVFMRPMGFLGLYKQAAGRGMRTLDGLLDGLETVEERLEAIAASDKPWCFVIDGVDIEKRVGGVCSTPNIIGLPSELDLDGVTLREAEKKLREFEEVKERVIGEKPKTYGELVARLEWVDQLLKAKHHSKDDWAVSDESFRYQKVPPGYTVELLSPEPGRYELRVAYKKQEILRKSGRKADLHHYMKHTIEYAEQAIAEHRKTRSKGTLMALSSKQIGCLRANGHKPVEIDAMAVGHAKKLVAQYMAGYLKKKVSA